MGSPTSFIYTPWINKELEIRQRFWCRSIRRREIVGSFCVNSRDGIAHSTSGTYEIIMGNNIAVVRTKNNIDNPTACATHRCTYVRIADTTSDDNGYCNYYYYYALRIWRIRMCIPDTVSDESGYYNYYDYRALRIGRNRGTTWSYRDIFYARVVSHARAHRITDRRDLSLAVFFPPVHFRAKRSFDLGSFGREKCTRRRRLFRNESDPIGKTCAPWRVCEIYYV